MDFRDYLKESIVAYLSENKQYDSFVKHLEKSLEINFRNADAKVTLEKNYINITVSQKGDELITEGVVKGSKITLIECFEDGGEHYGEQKVNFDMKKVSDAEKLAGLIEEIFNQ